MLPAEMKANTTEPMRAARSRNMPLANVQKGDMEEGS
jgi:hypothetical protein